MRYSSKHSNKTKELTSVFKILQRFLASNSRRRRRTRGGTCRLIRRWRCS